MKELILKGLGKAKVKRIIKLFLIDSFNECIGYHNGFSVYFGGIVDGYGLPEMDDDNPFTLDDLIEFVGGKI